MSAQGCTNSGRLVARASKLCRVASDIYSTTTAVFPLHTNMCIGSHAPSKKVPDNSEVRRSLQKCGVLAKEVASCYLSGALDLQVAYIFGKLVEPCVSR